MTYGAHEDILLFILSSLGAHNLTSVACCTTSLSTHVTILPSILQLSTFYLHPHLFTKPGVLQHPLELLSDLSYATVAHAPSFSFDSALRVVLDLLHCPLELLGDLPYAMIR
eukprot:1157118-Pelagomonas_calceolata.AAC.2